MTQDIPTVRLDKLLCEVANKKEVSDIHITEGFPLWVRHGGELSPAPGPLVSRESITEFLRHKAHETGHTVDAVMKALDQKGDEDLAFGLMGVRFRANVFRANDRKLSIILRRIPEEIPGIETLGLPAAFLPSVQQAKGLVLVTGATGSGKTTTLASVLSYINRTRAGHIVTIEDPVEYVIKSDKCLVHQRQVRREARDFIGSLRAAMRQDPDIILVGELRDQETVRTALDAANTGHLVMATLHTMSARQSIERLLSFFPPEGREYISSVLSQVLLAVLSQSLLRPTNGQGRVLAAELLLNTPTVKPAIQKGQHAQLFSAMDTGSKDGQLLLNRALKDLIARKLISREEALFHAYDPVGLMKELGMPAR